MPTASWVVGRLIGEIPADREITHSRSYVLARLETNESHRVR